MLIYVPQDSNIKFAVEDSELLTLREKIRDAPIPLLLGLA